VTACTLANPLQASGLDHAAPISGLPRATSLQVGGLRHRLSLIEWNTVAEEW
jgi:hypothetical protein